MRGWRKKNKSNHRELHDWNKIACIYFRFRIFPRSNVFSICFLFLSGVVWCLSLFFLFFFFFWFIHLECLSGTRLSHLSIRYYFISIFFLLFFCYFLCKVFVHTHIKMAYQYVCVPILCVDGRISIVYHINFLTQMLFERILKRKGFRAMMPGFVGPDGTDERMVGIKKAMYGAACISRWMDFGLKRTPRGESFLTAEWNAFFFFVIYGVSGTHTGYGPFVVGLLFRSQVTFSFTQYFFSGCALLLFFSSFFCWCGILE